MYYLTYAHLSLHWPCIHKCEPIYLLHHNIQQDRPNSCDELLEEVPPSKPHGNKSILTSLSHREGIVLVKGCYNRLMIHEYFYSKFY